MAIGSEADAGQHSTNCLTSFSKLRNNKNYCNKKYVLLSTLKPVIIKSFFPERLNYSFCVNCFVVISRELGYGNPISKLGMKVQTTMQK